MLMVNSSMEKVQPFAVSTVTNLGLISNVGKISLHSPTIDLMSGTSHAELKVRQLNQNFHIYNYAYTRFRFRGNLVDLGAVLNSFLGSKRSLELTLDSFTSTIIK